MPELTQPRDRDLFDEAGYLRRNPGLVEAIADRVILSGWDHYDKHGRREGRLPNDVDSDFYLAAYPIIAEDLGRTPSRGDAAAHFIVYGRARGYLPYATALRPDHPGAVESRYGGPWTDRADALDIIQNRFDLGRITDRQADRLRDWVRDGYVIINVGTAADRLAPAALALEQIFAGTIAAALFHCPPLGAEPMAWVPELVPQPATALDIHFLSPAVRSLLLAPMLANFLTELFDSPLLITGSEGVLRLNTCFPRQDSANFGHSGQRTFAGMWVGLDDPAVDDAMYVYPGSHRLADFRYGDRYKSMEEARRMEAGGLTEQEARHAADMLTAIRRGGLERRPLSPPHGSVVIWHPDLVTETTAVGPAEIRRGIRAWLCPRHATPLYSERAGTRRFTMDKHGFTSGVYLDQDALD